MNNNQYITRKKMRYEGFDYSSPLCYFITIVANKRKCIFGHIKDGQMILNQAGQMILEEYHLLERTSVGVFCMESVVMPNHFHCLIRLSEESHINIANLIGALKSRTTVNYIDGVKNCGWKTFEQHLWQRNYWDDIIWNQRQLEYVQNYILLNPSRWDKDNINPTHNDNVDHILLELKKLR